MVRKPGAPNDRLFRALVARSDRGARLVRSLLPPEVAVLVADVPIERVPGSFVDEGLRLHQTDALFRAELLDGGPAWIYFLVEHKAERDPWAPLQMARYVLRIWDWHAGQPDARPGILPPVIPLLVHHGRGPWTGPLSVLDMVEAPSPAAEFAKSLSCVLFDLGQTKTMDLPEDPEIRSVLAALKHARDRPVPRDVLRMILSGPLDGTELELQLAVYVSRTYDLDRDMLEAALRDARPERWENLMGTVADELVREQKAAWIAVGEARGELKGKIRGEARGQARGEAKAKAETFLRLARLKFGDIPETRDQQVRATPTATVDRWLDALFLADSLDAVFETGKR